jgi:hypothetical protein
LSIYRCPFCNRKLRATDFNCLVNHAESIGRCGARVRTTVNVHAFMAQHKALGIHLRSLQAAKIHVKCSLCWIYRQYYWICRQYIYAMLAAVCSLSCIFSGFVP